MYSMAALNLNRSLVFFFKSFFQYFLEKSTQKHGQSCTAFGAKKLTTSPFRTPCGANCVCTTHDYMLAILSICKQIQESLCDIFQSVHTSPVAACRNAWGGKNSLRSNIMPPVSAHCSATRCASQRCPLDKLLTLAAKSQLNLAFARLRVTFALGGGLPFNE